MGTLALDTCVISAFSSAGHFGVLGRILARHRCVVVEEVRAELRAGAASGLSCLNEALEAPWLEPVRLRSIAELRRFAFFIERLGTGGRDIGEAATMAWAQSNGGAVVTDDQVAFTLCQKEGIVCIRTLRLLATGVSENIVSVHQAGSILEEMVAQGARLRFKTATEFVDWYLVSGRVL